jgi:sporulation protein YlmC with PRC-barrel domain
MTADIETDESRTLIAADKVEGTAVYTRGGDDIGTIRTIMLNKLNGRVAYAVLASGGFLGLGEDYYPIPWEALRYDVDRGGYVVNVDSSHFETAPRYPKDSEPNWADRIFDQDVRGAWGVPLPV